MAVSIQVMDFFMDTPTFLELTHKLQMNKNERVKLQYWMR